MAGAPLITVVMANYNGARHLAEAVQSVQRQTLQDFELILVDDASTDDSLAVAWSLASADPRIRVLAQGRNQGPGAARNRALDAARGAWIAVADSDDVMLPSRLERLLRRAEREGARIVADNQTICSSDLSPESRFIDEARAAGLGRVDLATFIESSRLYSPLPDLGFVKPLIGSGLIAELGARYDESLRIGEDFHFVVSLLSSGAVLHLEPEPLYLYRKHAGSISHRMSEDTIAAMIRADSRARAALAHDAAAAGAMTRRIEGLRSWAVYERVMTAAKAGRWPQALAHALARPHAWALIGRPLRARLNRAAAPISGGAATAAVLDISAKGQV